MKMVALGDSQTFGYGIPQSSSWVSLSNKRLGAELGIEIVNKGVVGDTTGGFLARFSRDVVQETPQEVFIMGGGNDISATHSIEGTKANLWALVYQARNRCIEPILATMVNSDHIAPDWGFIADYPQRNEDIAALNQWIRDFGRVMQVSVIDFAQGLQDLADRYRQDELFFQDGLHLSLLGHELIADMFCREIRLLYRQHRKAESTSTDLRMQKKKEANFRV